MMKKEKETGTEKRGRRKQEREKNTIFSSNFEKSYIETQREKWRGENRKNETEMGNKEGEGEKGTSGDDEKGKRNRNRKEGEEKTRKEKEDHFFVKFRKIIHRNTEGEKGTSGDDEKGERNRNRKEGEEKTRKEKEDHFSVKFSFVVPYIHHAP